MTGDHVASPTIAVIGAGPSGCYTAQALRRALPSAGIDVFDSLPIPYGLLRYGVAADHRGTKALSRQFARLFEKDGIRFVGNVEIGRTVGLQSVRDAYDTVVVATGLHRDRLLAVPGGDLDGVVGAGRITRLLNGHPREPRPAPSLGSSVAIVGHGNVAMDVARLLAKNAASLDGSDIDDDAHAALTAGLRRMHLVGRSYSPGARFDIELVREFAALEDVAHVLHGLRDQDEDARTLALRALPAAGASERLVIEWWFGRSPTRILGGVAAEALEVCTERGDDAETLNVSSVISAIGFEADGGQQLAAIDEEARRTGRVAAGLYVAGWARTGPQGTIASQRTPARELAATIAAEMMNDPRRTGLPRLQPLLVSATTYEGWLRIDAAELSAATTARERRKVTDLDELVAIARGAGDTEVRDVERG